MDAELSNLTGSLGRLFNRPEPRVVFTQYVEGLLAALPKKNGWTPAERAGHVTPDRMQNNKDTPPGARAGRPSTRLRLLPAVRASGTPLPVSASGITSPGQAGDLLAAGYRGLLVGTALLLGESPRQWTEAWTGTSDS